MAARETSSCPCGTLASAGIHLAHCTAFEPTCSTCGDVGLVETDRHGTLGTCPTCRGRVPDPFDAWFDSLIVECGWSADGGVA